LVIGCEGKLVHWSVSQEKVTEEFNGVMDGKIHSIAQTSDKNYLFLSDHEGS
jgi:hypothetical protein